MGVTFQDSFSDDGIVWPLSNHVPDVGTGWVEILNNTPDPEVYFLYSDGVLRNSNGVNSAAVAYAAKPDPVVAEYDLEITVTAENASGFTQPFVMFGRLSGTTYYGVEVLPWNASGDDVRLFKRVSGTFTVLASGNLDVRTGHRVKLEIRDAAKKVYIDAGSGYVERLSSADNAITAAGQTGLGIGGNGLGPSGGHFRNWGLDDFVRTEVGGATVLFGPLRRGLRRGLRAGMST